MFKFEFMVLMSVNYPSYFKKSFVSNKFTKHPMHLIPISLHHNKIYLAECNKMESLRQNIWKRHAKIYIYGEREEKRPFSTLKGTTEILAKLS